jgi:hypothetical protein
MKKFELTTDFIIRDGVKLFRIRALIDFGIVKPGELGGFIEKEENLSQGGDAWVSGNARVYGNAQVYGNARVSGNAQVSGNARVSGNAQVSGNADYMCVTGSGREYRTTTFMRSKDGGVIVKCGCFGGTLQQFADKVAETHGDNKHGRVYRKAIEMAEIYFDCEEEQE